MPTRKFVTAVDEDSGIWGFQPIGIDGAEPAYGNGVAHDTLEHFVGTTGDGLADELMAFGAMWWIRVDNGFFLRQWNPDPIYQLKSDLGDFFNERGSGYLPEPPVRALHPRHTKRSQFHEFLRLMAAGAEECINEHGYDANEDEIEGMRESLDAAFQRRCAGWMMEGYLRAPRRYRGIDSYTVMELFKRLGQKMERIYKDLEGAGEPEGVEFTVSVFPKTDRIVIRGLEEWM
jgi:hypothetical protein